MVTLLRDQQPIVRTFETPEELYKFVQAFKLLYDYYPVVELKGYFKDKLSGDVVAFQWAEIDMPVYRYGFKSEKILYSCDGGECIAKIYYKNALEGA
jgi:hypothetical protein